MTAYFDASVLVPIVVAEPSSLAVQAFIDALHAKPLVSEFAAAETASAVSRLVRMGALSADAGEAALEDLDAWRFGSAELVDLTPADVRYAHLLVRRFETKLRAPDAIHVAVARRMGARLVSRDRMMRRAAEIVGIDAVDVVA